MLKIEYFGSKEATVQAREHSLVWDLQSLHLVIEAIAAAIIWTKAIANKELIIHLEWHSEEAAPTMRLHWKSWKDFSLLWAYFEVHQNYFKMVVLMILFPIEQVQTLELPLV